MSKILVVDDNLFSIRLTKELIEDALNGVEIEIVGVGSGKEALETFKSSQVGEYCLIIMDMIMPEMTGKEVIEAIRDCDRADADHVPIVIASSVHEDLIRQMMNERLVNDFVVKPLSVTKLATIIERYCLKEK